MPIANIFIPRILNKIRIETDYDEDDIDMMRYSLQAILWELEKTIYLIIIFTFAGLGWHFFAAMIAVLTIRPNAGGFHSSTVWGCFFWTLLGFFLALIALPHLIPTTNITILAVAIFSIPITYIASPLRSKQMERIADTSKDAHKKIKVTIITCIWFVVLFFYAQHPLATPVLWIIFLQNLQLGIEHIKRKTEKPTTAKENIKC